MLPSKFTKDDTWPSTQGPEWVAELGTDKSPDLEAYELGIFPQQSFCCLFKNVVSGEKHQYANNSLWEVGLQEMLFHFFFNFLSLGFYSSETGIASHSCPLILCELWWENLGQWCLTPWKKRPHSMFYGKMLYRGPNQSKDNQRALARPTLEKKS